VSKEIPMPQIRFWLNGLTNLKQDSNPQVRSYAASLLLDMGVEGVTVSEILEPIVLYPEDKLTPIEKEIRLTIISK